MPRRIFNQLSEYIYITLLNKNFKYPYIDVLYNNLSNIFLIKYKYINEKEQNINRLNTKKLTNEFSYVYVRNLFNMNDKFNILIYQCFLESNSYNT